MLELFSEIILYLIAGGVAGVLSGLFGVGGGLIIVPVLLLGFAWSDIDPQWHMQLAVGTSFATIILTSFSAFKAHLAKIDVSYRILAMLSAGLVVGVSAGGLLAVALPALWIKLFFIAFLVWVAQSLWRVKALSPDQSQRALSRVWYAPVSALIGGVSSFIGIGGGTMMVPFLHKTGFSMQKAVAMSSGTAVVIACTGAVTYSLAGLKVETLPPYTLGFVYLPAAISVVTTSVFFAKLGARLAHQLPERTLKRAFAVFLIVIALNMMLSLVI